MNDLKQQRDTDGSRSVGRRRLLVAGLLVGAVTVVAVVAFASRPSNPAAVPVGDQRIASTWAQENPQMWSWMQEHWGEMTLAHQHWGDVSWMQGNLSDYAWMRDHWNDMVWMHDHWSGMTWMHTQGMMGSASGAMMGQSAG